MCGCTRNLTCTRCREDDYRRLWLVEFDPDKTPDEEREERLQEHQTRVVLPALDGWGK